MFRAAIALFTLGSIFCGLSSTLSELVLARVLQGFGGAMMVPVGRLVVLRIVPKSGLVDAMSYLTIPAVLGPVLGPPVGGFIVTYSSWRWIFFMNVPIAILGMILVTLYIPDIKEEETIPLDLRGFLLTGLGLAGLVFGFETIGRAMIPVSLVMTVMTIGGLVRGTLLCFTRSRIDYPIVDLTLMRIPTFARVGPGRRTRADGHWRVAVSARDAAATGLRPESLCLRPDHLHQRGRRADDEVYGRPDRSPLRLPHVLIGNGLISGLLLISYATFRPGIPKSLMIGTLLAGGFFRSLQFTSLNTVAYADISPPMMSGASTLSSMAQQLFLSLGVTVAALVLHISLVLRGSSTLNANDFAAAFVVIGLVVARFDAVFRYRSNITRARKSAAISRLSDLAREPVPQAD